MLEWSIVGYSCYALCEIPISMQRICSPQLVILLNIAQVSGNYFPYSVDDAHKVDDGGEQWDDHLQLVASPLWSRYNILEVADDAVE